VSDNLAESQRLRLWPWPLLRTGRHIPVQQAAAGREAVVVSRNCEGVTETDVCVQVDAEGAG
jgi:hypothetical protein